MGSPGSGFPVVPKMDGWTRSGAKMDGWTRSGGHGHALA